MWSNLQPNWSTKPALVDIFPHFIQNAQQRECNKNWNFISPRNAFSYLCFMLKNQLMQFHVLNYQDLFAHWNGLCNLNCYRMPSSLIFHNFIATKLLIRSVAVMRNLCLGFVTATFNGITIVNHFDFKMRARKASKWPIERLLTFESIFADNDEEKTRRSDYFVLHNLYFQLFLSPQKVVVWDCHAGGR